MTHKVSFALGHRRSWKHPIIRIGMGVPDFDFDFSKFLFCKYYVVRGELKRVEWYLSKHSGRIDKKRSNKMLWIDFSISVFSFTWMTICDVYFFQNHLRTDKFWPRNIWRQNAFTLHPVSLVNEGDHKWASHDIWWAKYSINGAHVLS